MDIKFGTAGVPLSTKDSSTDSGVKRVRELGLDAMEVEFVHGVRMKTEKAEHVFSTAQTNQIALTCHAPYYINLNSAEVEKVEASKDRILHTARIAKVLGATGIVFHPAFYANDSSEKVLQRVINELTDVRGQLDKENNNVILRPETTGKPTQFGDLEETIRLAQEVPGVLPCIDFSHLHARSNGDINSYDGYCKILDQTAEALKDRWIHNGHFHISGIEYNQKGEKKHLILKDSDLRYEELLKAIISFGIEGTVICESPNMEEDALLLQATYFQLKKQ